MFNPVTAKLICEILIEGKVPPSPSAVDLGNQTFGVDARTMQRIVQRLLASPAVEPRHINYDLLRSLIGGDPKSPTGPRVEQFYRALGFARYDAIDINTRYGSLVMDLNLDLKAHHGFQRTYDLVVNTGTSEHVFNQAAFLKNAHDLARPGGLMLHVVPFTGYMNHGFYNYQPNLFLDLAAANQYSVERLHLADRNEVLRDLSAGRTDPMLPWLGLLPRNEKGNGFLVALLRRRAEEDFVLPCQGKYLSTLEGASLTRYYADQTRREHETAGSILPMATASVGGAPSGVRRKVKKALLKSLRAASRFVLTRL